MTMDLYWIYDIPTLKLGLGIIGLYVGISLAGLAILRRWLHQAFDISSEMNEMTNGIFSGVGVLYGLLVGLVAVAAWQNYDSVDEIVSKEASMTASLYRDVSALHSPARERMQHQLRNYLNEVIDVAWPLHRQGKADIEGATILSQLHAELADYRPSALADDALYRESLTAFNRLAEARRLRLGEVNTGIPAVFWLVIIIGALLTLPLIYLFHTTRASTHFIVTSIYGMFMGSMIFLLVAVDNPLRGEVSISSDAYQSVLQSLESLDPNFWRSKSPHP